MTSMMGACMAGMGMAGMLIPLTSLALLTAVVAFAIRRSQERAPLRPAALETGDRAVGLLRERYARGEIDREEYEERRRTLSADSSHWP